MNRCLSKLFCSQDGNGGIWVVELEIDKIECDHRKVITCHAGGVVAIAALRTHPILITAGEDGALHAYDTEKHTLLARYVFPKPITTILYPPLDVSGNVYVNMKQIANRMIFCNRYSVITQKINKRMKSQVDETSRILILGFQDGTMRTILVYPDRLQGRTSMINIRVNSSLTVHSDDSIHGDVIHMISVRCKYSMIKKLLNICE